MAKVSIHVWHRPTGEIIGVGQPKGAAKGKCVPLPGPNQVVLETEFEEKHIATLYQTHMVDVGQKTLVKRSDSKK